MCSISRFALLASFVVSAINASFAADATVADFESTAPSRWHSTIGKWEVQDGVMVGSEQESDHHAAAARLLIPFRDGKVTGKFRNLDARAVNLGFDPFKGELKKKGHLCACTILPTRISLSLSPDKANPESKPENLATLKASTAVNQWVNFAIQFEGEHITVEIGDSKLKASHAQLACKKTGLIVRVMGGNVQFDDLAITPVNPE